MFTASQHQIPLIPCIPLLLPLCSTSKFLLRFHCSVNKPLCPQVQNVAMWWRGLYEKILSHWKPLKVWCNDQLTVPQFAPVMLSITSIWTRHHGVLPCLYSNHHVELWHFILEYVFKICTYPVYLFNEQQRWPIKL